jgi:diaminohydroxyphosphoribosylaminopyrimidine deaminase/5-amino-6-(5-phosphoribosylamino)uracil reductase
VIVDGQGNEISQGFSRERPHFHAEESALSKIAPDDERLPDATLYSSLEPCARRRSRPCTCAELIIASGIRRVVIAWREPPVFVADAHGADALRAAGITVVEVSELADAAATMNAHILDPDANARSLSRASGATSLTAWGRAGGVEVGVVFPISCARSPGIRFNSLKGLPPRSSRRKTVNAVHRAAEWCPAPGGHQVISGSRSVAMNSHATTATRVTRRKVWPHVRSASRTVLPTSWAVVDFMGPP